MRVTSVRLRVFPVGERRVKAVGSLVLDQCFQIEHVHVVEKEDGTLIVAMPSRFEYGRYHDVAHPITVEFRAMVNRAVMDEFERASLSHRADKPLTGLTSPAKVSP